MLGRRVVLGRVLGFEIRADVSWVFLALLVLWSLASGFFPLVYPGLPQATYWTLALVGTVGLFVSLLLHELSHSVVARAYGIPVSGITLFLFGGAAEMEREPDTPGSEFLMAIAGPIASLAIAVAFYLVMIVSDGLGATDHWAGVPRYLAIVNVALAVFNMLPAFPMDGGRALRAALWHYGKDLRRATRVASVMGQGLGILLMAGGAAHLLLLGNFVGGMWWVLIGLFVNGNAAATYRQLLDRLELRGLQVRQIMTADPVVVAPDRTLREVLDTTIYRHHHHRYPVVHDGRLLGHLGTRQIKALPQERWPEVTVREVMQPRDPATTIAPTRSAQDALERLQASEDGWLMVAQGDRLLGVLALRDLRQHLQLRQELEPSRSP